MGFALSLQGKKKKKRKVPFHSGQQKGGKRKKKKKKEKNLEALAFLATACPRHSVGTD